MVSPIDLLQQKCRTLRLAETAKELPSLLRKAEAEHWTYHEFVHELLTYETLCRDQKNVERLMKWANFPYDKTLEDYQLEEQQALSDRQLKLLKELHWVEDMFSIILMGPPGTGKTLLSVGLGTLAIENGYQVGFVSMAELMYVLKSKEYIPKSKTKYKRLTTSNLIIIDDIMFMTIDPEEASYFFQFIYDMYDRAAFILTSNKGPGEWGKFLGDTSLTTAILDRLLHRSEIISFGEDEESFRMKHRKTIFDSSTAQS